MSKGKGFWVLYLGCQKQRGKEIGILLMQGADKVQGSLWRNLCRLSLL